ncbi:MAG: TlpA disulfide reductase family protein [Gemmatimonadota bacterium]
MTLLWPAAVVASLIGVGPGPAADSLPGSWRAVLDLAGGALPFSLTLTRGRPGLTGRICNGLSCTDLSGVVAQGDSVVFDMADYAATITVGQRGDSLVGMYRNVGNRGPRAIPFRASRGSWPISKAPATLLGSWDATFVTDGRKSPRVFEFRNGPQGLEASFQANSGDYGLFSGRASADSFVVAHFDGSFVYLAAGRLDGDTLRGVFNAGVRTRTPFTAVRSTGRSHLIAPTELTRADTVNPFRFSFPDLAGAMVSNGDPRFRGKVVLIDVFGTWCPTCHDAAPTLVDLHREFHAKGLEVIGLAYEVSGDSATDNRMIRRFRDKFKIPYLLLRGGLNDVEATAATLPQLTGFTAYPTSIFIGRDGRVKQVYAGFRGPATGAQYERQIAEMRETVKRLLAQ